MNQRPEKSFRCREGRVWRHLNVIRRRGVERTVATEADDRAAVGDNDFRCFRRTPRRFLDGGRNVSRNSLDLAGVEQGEGAQQWNMPYRVLVTIRSVCLVVAQFEPLEKIPGRAALALANLPAPVFGLLVSGPTGIAADEGLRGHPKREHIDPAIALTGRRVARHRRAAGLVRIPRPAPGWCARLKCRDNAVGNLLIVVAWHAVIVVSPIHWSGCGAHRGVLHEFLEHPSRPASRPNGARARLSREAIGRSLAAGGRRCGRKFYFNFVRTIPPPGFPRFCFLLSKKRNIRRGGERRAGEGWTRSSATAPLPSR